jgi:hypothetical protein
VWQLTVLHVTEPAGPVSLAEAQSLTDIKLPASAVHVRIAGYSQWVQYEHFMRFEAPVADCLSVAAAVVPGQELEPVDDADRLADQGPTRKDVFRNFNWFDLSKSRNLVCAGFGPNTPMVWVDLDRGVFYYRKSD